MSTPEPPRRERVTNPRTSSTPRNPRSVEQEIDEATSVGEVYMRSLIRSQLRLALIVLLVLVITIGGMPLAFVAFPSFFQHRWAGVPLPWWILGFAVYPCLFLGGWLYVRQSERAEQDFADLVERP
ncbi:hypothetical protein BH09ACT10_BH09ACT10_07730 [soil metagenome]